MRKLTFLTFALAGLVLTSCSKKDDDVDIVNQLVESDTTEVVFGVDTGRTSLTSKGDKTFVPFLGKGGELSPSFARNSNFVLDLPSGSNQVALTRTGGAIENIMVDFTSSAPVTVNNGAITSYSGSAGDRNANISSTLPFTLQTGNSLFISPSTTSVDLDAETAHSILTVQGDSSITGVRISGQPINDSKTWNGNTVNYAYVRSGQTSLTVDGLYSLTVSGTTYTGQIQTVIPSVATYTHYALSLTTSYTFVPGTTDVRINVNFVNSFTQQTITGSATVEIVSPPNPVETFTNQGYGVTLNRTRASGAGSLLSLSVPGEGSGVNALFGSYGITYSTGDVLRFTNGSTSFRATVGTLANGFLTLTAIDDIRFVANTRYEVAKRD